MKNLLFLIAFTATMFFGCSKSEKEEKIPLIGIFVSPDGNDNNLGSNENEPLKTIQKAVDLAVPGDTIYVRKGFYNEKISIRSSGTPSKNISLKAYPSETPVIDGSNILDSISNPDYALIRLENAHYISIQGLRIQNAKASGIYGKDGSSNVAVERCSIINCTAPAICFGADNKASENIKILHNFIDSCASLHREAISLRTVNTFEIAHNKLINVVKESIDAKSGSKNGTIHHNEMENSGDVGIYIDAGYANNPMNDGLYNIHIFQNKFINPKGIGICIASEAGNKGSNIHVYNNLIYDLKKQSGAGIKIADHEMNGPLENIYIYNNTIYGRAQQGIYVNTSLIKNIVIRNNISAQNWIQIKIREDANIDFNEITIENNLSWGTSNEGDFGTNAIRQDPLFVDEQNGNFALKSTSPAIDNGISDGAPEFDIVGTKRPQGKGFDIGAYEHPM